MDSIEKLRKNEIRRLSRRTPDEPHPVDALLAHAIGRTLNDETQKKYRKHVEKRDADTNQMRIQEIEALPPSTKPTREAGAKPIRQKELVERLTSGRQDNNIVATPQSALNLGETGEALLPLYKLSPEDHLRIIRRFAALTARIRRHAHQGSARGIWQRIKKFLGRADHNNVELARKIELRLAEACYSPSTLPFPLTHEIKTVLQRLSPKLFESETFGDYLGDDFCTRFVQPATRREARRRPEPHRRSGYCASSEKLAGVGPATLLGIQIRGGTPRRDRPDTEYARRSAPDAFV